MATRIPTYNTTTKPESRGIGLRYNLAIPQVGAIHVLVLHVNTSNGQAYHSLDEEDARDVDECYDNHSIQTQGKWRVVSVKATTGDKWFPRRVWLERVSE